MRRLSTGPCASRPAVDGNAGPASRALPCPALEYCLSRTTLPPGTLVPGYCNSSSAAASARRFGVQCSDKNGLLTHLQAKMSRLISLYFAAAFLAFGMTGCGMSDNSNRALESITVTPATASAQSSTSGQVQFTAAGSFSKPPTPAPLRFDAPYSGGWETSDPTIATITPGGVAQCTGGASGMVTVIAQASANKVSGPAMSVVVSGTAQLMCQ
jgi:hypothetical protein